MAIINNVAYSWSMITLSSTALGIDEGSTTLEGVSAIKWSKKRKVESNYGMGGRPVSRGFGNITYTASITMDYATQQLLRGIVHRDARRIGNVPEPPRHRPSSHAVVTFDLALLRPFDGRHAFKGRGTFIDSQGGR